MTPESTGKGQKELEEDTRSVGRTAHSIPLRQASSSLPDLLPQIDIGDSRAVYLLDPREEEERGICLCLDMVREAGLDLDLDLQV